MVNMEEIHNQILAENTRNMYQAPPHCGPASDPYEAIKVIEAWRLNFSLGNVLKYIARAGKKGGPADHVADLEKAAWYLKREIERVKKEKAP